MITTTVIAEGERIMARAYHRQQWRERLVLAGMAVVAAGYLVALVELGVWAVKVVLG